MKRPLILTDADNTLWDTDAVFANAQLGLLTLVEEATGSACPDSDRLSFVRRYDQALAKLHHAHLKYPPMLLVRALQLALEGAGPESVATAVIQGRNRTSQLDQTAVELVVQAYLGMLSDLPQLLPTVAEGLSIARGAGIGMYILSEGKIEKQRKLVSHYSLDDSFAGVFEVSKNQSQFERLRQRFAHHDVVVMGDQPDRDVVPAKTAGCTTILIPSRFRPHWQDPTHWNSADFVATTFKEGIDWVLQQTGH